MDRIENVCPGDCTKCELLMEGKVEMNSCIMDQVFQRVQNNERMLSTILERLPVKRQSKTLAAIKSEEE